MGSKLGHGVVVGEKGGDLLGVALRGLCAGLSGLVTFAGVDGAGLGEPAVEVRELGEMLLQQGHDLDVHYGSPLEFRAQRAR